MKKNKVLFTGYEWDVDLIDSLWAVIDKIGKEDLGLDYYEPQFDVVTSQQMIDAYCSVGMPLFYNHWSFGKQYAAYQQDYKNGHMGLAYEMVINSNPCLAYLMEDNTATMTALVIAHANVGHAAFFKNNYLFQQHTDPHSILNLLEYAKKYISKCEDLYGSDEVELLLDHLHTLSKFGVDKFPRKEPLTDSVLQQRALDKLENEQALYNEDFKSLPFDPFERTRKHLRDCFSKYSDEEDPNSIDINEENLLRVVEDYSLVLAPWEREIVRIIRKIEQYFFPQGQTKVMNEGFACFIHYYIMTELYDQGYIDEGAYLEFLQSHTSVCYQPDGAHLNPYALGFEMFMDIKRACLNPDEEDYVWLKTIAGKEDWRAEIKHIVKYYKDESFILQFLSPKVIRKFKLFALKDIADEDTYEITGIQSDEDIHNIRKVLCNQYELDNRRPDIEAVKIDRVENKLTLCYTPYKERGLEDHSLVEDILEDLLGLEVVIINSEE